MLLRSAGIVGLAGVIMAIAAGDTFFGGPPRTREAQSATAVEQEETAPEGVIVAAVVAPAAADRVVLAEQRPAAVEPVAVAPPAIVPVAVAPPAVVPPATAEPKSAEPRPQQARRPTVGFTLSSPSFYSADPMRFTPPAPSVVPPEAVVAAAAAVSDPAAAQPDEASLWEVEAIECPRDWIEVPDSEVGGGAHCRTNVALFAMRPSFPADEPAETATTNEVFESTTDADAGSVSETIETAVDADTTAAPSADEVAEVESALATRALELAGFVARVPLPRPDPPPVRRTSSRNHRADWPAEPPPNCGGLHAYWRFTDRKAGTKEWYCR
jgi:hypothetical protein